MKLKPSSYFTMVIMAVSLAIVLRALTFEYQSIKMLPIIIGGIVFVLATISLVRDLLSKKETRGPEEETSLRTYWRTGTWIAAFALAIYLLGFIIAIPLFILSYLKWHGRRWLIAMGIAGVTTVFIYVAFELSLRVQLYRGLLLTW